MHSEIMQIPLFEFFLIHSILFLFYFIGYLSNTRKTLRLPDDMQVLILFVMLLQLILQFYDLCVIMCVHPNHLYLAIQIMQTINSTAMQEQRMYLITCVDPTVLQMNGLQQFKYHIFIIILYFQTRYLMRAKPILQQPFGKIQASRHLTIKIHQPQSNHLDPVFFPKNNNDSQIHHIIKDEIKEVKARIQNSEKILEESRRQAQLRLKNVPSDNIRLRFNYDSAKAQHIKMILDPLDEKSQEYSQENQQSQGQIQLPMHLQQSKDERNYLSTRNTENKQHFRSNHSPYLNHQQEINEPSWKTDRGLFLNQFTSSLEKKKINKFIKPCKTPKSHRRAEGYSDHFAKYLSKSKSKDKFLIDYDQKKIRNYLINLERQSSLKKSKQKSITKTDSKSKQIPQSTTKKIKIKLNCPNYAKFDPKNNYQTRPRYQIQMPSDKKYFQSELYNKQKQIGSTLPTTNGWQELRQKLVKYEFVRKYLTQSDLYEIYEHLKKNHINQQKWPLFVVDEAYKRMNAVKNH